MLLWEGTTSYLAGKRKSQTYFGLNFIGEILPDFFKLRCNFFVFFVFTVWNSVPIQHSFQILFFSRVHTLPCPSANHLVTIHQRGISRLTDRIWYSCHG